MSATAVDASSHLPRFAATVYRADLRYARTFVTSSQSIARLEAVLVCIRDIDGRVGWGELSPAPGEDRAGAVAQLLDGARRCDVWANADLDALDDRIGEVTPSVRSAFATACLDLAGTCRGVAAAELLTPGAPDRVRANGLVGGGHPSVRRVVLADMARRGFDVVKLKVGDASWCHELDLLEETATLHPRLRVRLDPNMAWTSAELDDRLRSLDGLPVDYVEQPTAIEHIDDWLNVEVTRRVLLAYDEALLDPEVRQRVLAGPPGRRLVLKPAWLGGPDRALAFARDAIAAGHRCVVTTTLESSVGRAMAVHVAAAVDALQGGVTYHGVATGELLADDVCEPPIPSDPLIGVAGPGLGVRPAHHRLAEVPL